MYHVENTELYTSSTTKLWFLACPFSAARSCQERNIARPTGGGECVAGEAWEGVAQGGVRMEARQSTARNQLHLVVFTLHCCGWGEREEDAAPLCRTVSPRMEVLTSQLQVAVQNIIWDQKA